MSFHYRRESSTEGILHRDNGLGPGISVSEMLQQRNFSVSASLEILAYCADALNDAQKNGFVHGELNLSSICIGQDGSVIVNGFGRPRSFSHAPERVPAGPATDIYGLGVALLALLSGRENFAPPLESEDHDTVVVEQMIALDWQELQDQPWLNKIQEFLISMLSQDPGERPLALDVANVLFSILPLTTGPTLSETTAQCQRMFDYAETEETEDLNTPVAIEAPSVQPAALLPDSSQGAETGLWPRDRIQQILMQEEFQEKAERKTWTPAPKPELRIEPTLDTASHPPRRPEPTPPPPAAPPPPSMPPVSGFSADDDTGAMHRSQHVPPVKKPPPSAITAGAGRQPLPPPPPREKEGPPWLKLAVAGGLALVLLCGIGGGLVGILAWNASDSPQEEPSLAAGSSEESVEEAQEPEPSPEPEAEAEAEEEKAEEIEVIQTRKPKKSPKKRAAPKLSKQRAQSEQGASTPARKPARQNRTPPAQPVLAQGDFSVRFMLPRMEGKIICGDGQNIDFVESVTVKFTDQQACRIQTDEARGAYIARAKATVRCTDMGGEISCK